MDIVTGLPPSPSPLLLLLHPHPPTSHWSVHAPDPRHGAIRSGVTLLLPQVASSPSHLYVVWAVPSSRGSALMSYHVQLTNQNTTQLLSVLATETQASLDGLQPDTAYQ